MSEKIRREFELWAQHELGYCAGAKADGTYYVTKINDMLSAWQASRAALVVELPANCMGMALTVDELRVVLDEIGVTLK